MAETLTTFVARVDEKITNVSTVDLTTPQKQANVGQAVSEYSRLRPLESVVDTSGDGNYEYALPTGWVNDFSIFTKIEYPAGNAQDPSDNTIQAENYMVYRNASARKLRFLNITPSAGNTIRQTFTIKHTVDAEGSTVFSNDFDAVCALAAAFCCFDLARRYAQDSDSFISADAVDRRGKSSKFSEIGRGLLKEYATHMGLGDQTVTAAVGIKDLDLEFDWGQDFITHPAANR